MVAIAISRRQLVDVLRLRQGKSRSTSARRPRVVIRQKIRQRDLAAMAGIARENVTRILNDWQRRKLVSRLSGYYCLENKALLEHQVKH